ncbi:MAG: copper chaperone PCu(A)C [Alysiella sp.]|uniref:copper chaperone PCu(A)C n=1 Tax=Alysiella sp. TaxID=1872483 RepID=UPI0026DCB4A8|nr:copper chaperone PCu(A)C [Alysiella sp.]MDO4433315.1 copper chaperone PCu(A)C [Alysiella sp.]
MVKKALFTVVATLLCQNLFAADIEATNAYARATVGQKQSGAFLTLKNTTHKDDILIAASVSPDIAENTELHTHINDNGVMRMREVKDGIPIAAGQTQELKPGGYHIMFFGLKNTLTAGQTLPIKLKFKNGSEQTVEFEVRNMQATHQHKNQQHNHTHHHH